MAQTVGSEELTRNVRRTLEKAREQPVIVTKWGEPHSVILSFQEWQKRCNEESDDN